MTYNPKVSYTTQDAVVDSTFSKTMLIVGQSNVAIDGLYKDIQRKTTKEIEAEFGADSHLTSCINDAKSTFANSITKPKIWAISYSDEATAVERVLTSTISGDATESKTMLIKINSLNTDRTSAKVAAVLSLRNTKGAFCGEFAQGPIQFGSPVNARRNFNPIFKNPTLNDVVVEVQITSGMTSDEVATAIDDAINAKTNSIYSSSVLASDVTITAKHKGSLGNMFSFEIVPTSIAAGLAATTVETIPGTGVVDTAGILDIEDTEGNKLRNLDFNYLTIPYG
ncbi:MAG: phage tail sheath gpL-like, partial [Psychroserpens sp.]